MSISTKMRCDGQRVRQRRLLQSMTQEKLAAMSKVSSRTVQRAEESEFLQLDTLASLASALGVTVPDIALLAQTVEQNGQSETNESNAVVLRRMRSGMALVELICDSFSGQLYCAAEPTAENIATFTDIVERVERLTPKPWETPFEAESPTLAQRLREALAITSKLAELEKFGIAVYAGTYTARAKVPRYDPDEGCMYTRTTQKFEPVTVCRVSINPAGGDRVTVKVSGEWPEEARPTTLPIQNDDEIPWL